MKKKITAIFLCVALVAIAIVGASLAYFTDTKTATNTFTMGDVKIKLDETNVNDPTGDRTIVGNDYNVYPGAVVTKDPTVHNTGKNAAWIRATVKVEGWVATCKDCYNFEGADYAATLVRYLVAEGALGTGWSVEKATVDANNGDVTFTLKYANALAAGTSTTAMFQQVQVPTGLVNGKTLGTITVTAEAIQADGFADWDAAFAAFDAN